MTIGAYRIFGCTGGAAEDVVIKAMEMAYEAGTTWLGSVRMIGVPFNMLRSFIGCDIINLSLSVESAWPENPMAVVADRLAQKGAIGNCSFDLVHCMCMLLMFCFKLLLWRGIKVDKGYSCKPALVQARALSQWDPWKILFVMTRFFMLASSPINLIVSGARQMITMTMTYTHVYYSVCIVNVNRKHA